MDFNSVGVQASAPPPYNPGYPQEHRSSGLSSTIATIAIIAFSLIAAAAVSRDAPPLALMLRIVAGGVGLIWLFSRSRRHRHGGGYHQAYHSPQPSVVVVQEPPRQVYQQQPSVVVVQQPHQRRNSWSGGFGLGNLFGLGSQPMYQAPATRYAQQHQQQSHHGVPPVARAPAQQHGNQPMYVAPQTRGTPPPPVYQQPPQGGYGNGNVIPPVARAPAQQHGGQPMYEAPSTRGSVYPSAATYQATPAAYSAPPLNRGGNPGGPPMYQAPADRKK